ncbi:cellulase family glycosylhydrolase [Anditalea andensis]|nr:cellulase family glycosylhydrolase [Anditalea andensis]
MKSFKTIFAHLLFLFYFSSCADEQVVPTEVQLEVSPGALEFGPESGEGTIEVTSNTFWSSSTDVDWITLSNHPSSQSGLLVVGVSPNPSTSHRAAMITFTAEELTLDVQVIQQGSQQEASHNLPPDATGMRDLSSLEMAKLLKVGWNLGNSLEAIGGETAWGNPPVSETLINAVKAAGFNAVRIPVAWSRFSDANTFTIDESWMDRVEEVVNDVLNNDMYAIINIHWDNGWIQPTFAEQEYVTERLEAMWRQIAINFRDYDDKLLFAGTNEVMVTGDYSTPSEEYYTVQNGYNQTFVNTVRTTGGRNAYRHLVVQGFNTNIDHTVNFARIPDDTTEDRILMEVHYYDPYNFSLNENSLVSQWGKDATDPTATETWANEPYVDRQFQKIKNSFIDQGIGVILGEYGAISRLNVEGHEGYREYYIQYITRSAHRHGLVPFYWDNGYSGNHGFAIFDRNTGARIYPEIVNAIMDSVD